MKKQLSPNTIAVFDFDGTITRKDTLKDFLTHNFGFTKYYGGIFSKSIIIVLYLFKQVNSHIAKEALFAHFFTDWEEEQFNDSCESYALTRIQNLIRKEGCEKIEWHKKQGHHLVIASASMKNWIYPWAIKNGFSDVIATEPEIENGLLTGRFRTPNCNGKEKAKRFLEKYPNREQYDLYVYGDSKGDRDLLSIADKPFYRRFY